MTRYHPPPPSHFHHHHPTSTTTIRRLHLPHLTWWPDWSTLSSRQRVFAVGVVVVVGVAEAVYMLPAEADVEADVEAEVEAWVEAEVGADTDAEAEAESDAEADAEAEAKVRVEVEIEAKDEAKAEAMSEAEAVKFSLLKALFIISMNILLMSHIAQTEAIIKARAKL
ncbi:hypothetical protein Tco_0005108, partial [Tanacetum coccineum]